MRVVVLGNSGSGKSTYAKNICSKHLLKHLDLDTLVWEPNQIAIERERSQVVADLNTFMANNPEWCIEGCYASLIEIAASQCTEFVFLNPGVEICLAHNLARPWEPHKYASFEEQNAMLENLQEWVRTYSSRDDDCSYSSHRRVFDHFHGPKTECKTESPYIDKPV